MQAIEYVGPMSDLPPLTSATSEPAGGSALPAQPSAAESPTIADETKVPPVDPRAAAEKPPATVKSAPVVADVAGEAMPTTSGIGVLLVNLGTPDAAEPKAVRRYLKEFLTDPRVIERDSLFWKFLLNGIILPLRSRRKARDYQKIWNREQNESPLKTITRSQAEKLAGILEPLGKHVVVDWAMRYANPSIVSRLEALIASGCDRILLMPLYPQYAAPTTATVCDEVFRYLMTL